MGLDLWFREDIARILASTQQTLTNALHTTSPSDPDSAEAYRQGFEDALQAVAIAFGLATPGHRPGSSARRPANGQGHATIDGRWYTQE